MAYAILSKPGTSLGPCIDPCQHKDCAESRRMVAELCPHCGEPIGYDKRFCQDQHGRLEHWSCALGEFGADVAAGTMTSAEAVALVEDDPAEDDEARCACGSPAVHLNAAGNPVCRYYPCC